MLGFSRTTYVSSTLRILCINFRKPPYLSNTTNDSCSLLCFYGWRYRLRSYVLRVKAECTTIVLSAKELPVFPSRQRYAVCLLRYTATSSFSASCFRWRGLSVAASVLSNRTGKPLPCRKLSAIHVHRRIVASTSCGKYLSRLFFIPFNHNVAMLRPTCPV